MRRMYSKPQLLEAVESESKLNGIKVFEDIKDKDGHKRFIEGDITIETITGVKQTYGKWSLSGSHLLLVIGFDVDNATVFSSTVLAEIALPKWIHDKIFPLFATNVVSRHDLTMYADNQTNQQVACFLFKISDSKLRIMFGGVTLSADRHGRVAFDLLIDNE